MPRMKPTPEMKRLADWLNANQSRLIAHEVAKGEAMAERLKQEMLAHPLQVQELYDPESEYFDLERGPDGLIHVPTEKPGLDLVVCPDCDDFFCLAHDMHYADCECPGNPFALYVEEDDED